MIVLKTKSFTTPEDIVKFVNKNNIKREDIFIITTQPVAGAQNTIFYYADSETKEITRGVFGWKDE